MEWHETKRNGTEGRRQAQPQQWTSGMAICCNNFYARSKGWREHIGLYKLCIKSWTNNLIWILNIYIYRLVITVSLTLLDTSLQGKTHVHLRASITPPMQPIARCLLVSFVNCFCCAGVCACVCVASIRIVCCVALNYTFVVTKKSWTSRHSSKKK